MGTSLIKDIRLFESDVPNIDYNSIPSYIGKLYKYDHIECLDIIQRLLFLLRYRGFGFDSFDHLYINFTPFVPHGEVRNVNRYNIKEFSWYQYVDAGCDPDIFNNWTINRKTDFIIENIKEAALIKCTDEQQQLFTDTFDEVIRLGKDLLIPYKQKKNQNYNIEIFTRIDNELNFIPLIRINDKSGTLKTEKKLRNYGRDEFIAQMGNITIGRSFVRIAPRKNQHTDFYDLTPIKIEW